MSKEKSLLNSGLRQKKMIEFLYLDAHDGVYVCCGIRAVHVCTHPPEACIVLCCIVHLTIF